MLCILRFDRTILAGPKAREPIGWILAKDLQELRMRCDLAKVPELMAFANALDRIPSPGMRRMPNGDILIVQDEDPLAPVVTTN